MWDNDLVSRFVDNSEYAGARSAGAHAFMLIEMLVVLVIVALIMGIAMPALTKLTSSGGVDSAARMVAAQLRLARQHAVTRRKRVAVLFPSIDIENTGAAGSYQTGSWSSDQKQWIQPYLNTSMRACYVDSSNQFLSWVSGTKWERLPVGASVFEADSDGSPDGGFHHEGATMPSDDGMTSVGGVVFPVGNPAGNFDDTGSSGGTVDADDGMESVRAVVFKPTGALAGETEQVVTVGEGAYNAGWVIRNGKNYRDMSIDAFTGRCWFRDLEDE